jgi:hypothetical protein
MKALLFAVMTLGCASAHAQASCLAIETNGPAQALVNTCPYPVEAVWCVAPSGARCGGFNLRANIRPGQRYAVGRGYVSWNACRGINSVDRIVGASVYCLRPGQ